MAMNKKEREQFQAAIDRADMLHALRWTEPVERDLPPPESFGLSKGFRLSKGFDYCDYWNSPRVDKACSSSVHHAFGRDDDTTTQGARTLFSNRLLALRALRHAMEVQAAKMLMGIDRQIAKCREELELKALDNIPEM